jgi:hemolysin D
VSNAEIAVGVRGPAHPHFWHIAILGCSIPISPGMNVTAEIKTGKRKLIEFLLSPVQKMGSESLKER